MGSLSLPLISLPWMNENYEKRVNVYLLWSFDLKNLNLSAISPRGYFAFKPLQHQIYLNNI
jgi:hypothetical protein